ncbi:hypothetical protein [Persephonella sp. KM09-Lau-8]|uniref:hypothetical protein n=1 Tax=Persephonella sp. KM09-Lau-8 TaxID=1158345 RepID=UPI0012DEFF90|nr:hypothetical protein [Persephonella sp. KM09-Lau-8]
MKKKNPFTKLSKTSPFVVEIEKNKILEINSKLNYCYTLRIELYPEPYLGNPNAPIVLLNLNPGFSCEELDWMENFTYRKLNKKNLFHLNKDYPFYLLNPKLSLHPGYKWWSKKLKYLIDGFGRKKVSHKIFVIEYIPYHSQKYSNKLDKLNFVSHRYTKLLLKSAINRGALIIFMRSFKKWENRYPFLKDYPNKCYLKNVRNPTITEGNLNKSCYSKLVKIMEN